MHPARNINLPKLDRIIVRNNGNYKGAGYHHNYHDKERDRSGDRRQQVNIDVSNLLKI